jgi:hydroxymethylglutaryl-CoA lyase
MAALGLPDRVLIQEEGPREGFQGEGHIALEDRLLLIDALGGAGLASVNCVSFVDPKRVPQMADADELARRIVRRPHVRYTGIWLNGKGFDRALASGLDLQPNVVASASSAFSIENNGCAGSELIQRQGAMIERYRAAGLELAEAHVLTAFGCHYEGPLSPDRCMQTLSDLLDVCAEHEAMPRTVYFCDTVGAANPNQVRTLLNRARSRWPDLEFALHLHDTRGMGLANALAGLEMGVRRFDASIAGMGGCPFAGNHAAAGNICTEDFALMCEEMGIATGLDLDALAECARLAQSIVGHPLPGKSMNARRMLRRPAEPSS